MRVRNLVRAKASQSPVVPSEYWLDADDEDTRHVLRIDLPLSAQEMVAALYIDRGDFDLDAGLAELADNSYVWERVALAAVWKAESQICDQEPRGKLADPALLAHLRRRVYKVTSTRRAAVPDPDPGRPEWSMTSNG
jgi:hypothetical protein